MCTGDVCGLSGEDGEALGLFGRDERLEGRFGGMDGIFAPFCPASIVCLVDSKLREV